MIGSVIDKYEVLQRLGEGATATVYRGRHLTIGKDVAIKVLHPHLTASSRNRERFNREARAVGRLSHPNIVSILDYSGQTADECYIVTELVDGVTLLELLQRHGRLPSEIAALVGIELCGALAFAHAQGVIHRDIKPENVMIRRDGRVKLMDFGVARVLDEGSITLDGSLLGSPAYMSPQQAMDETLDGRSDLFSLGTVLFHAVTGHVPFSGGNASVILRNIIDGNRPEVLELTPGASPAVAATIDRLLQARPEDRFLDADKVGEALVACLAEVRLTPEHPVVNLRSFLVNPEGCEQALDAHLRATLLDVGKERLAAGEQLAALQLFNRLLAVDEENEEVIALIQSLHQGPETRRPGRGIALVAAVALVLGGAGAWTWWAGRTPEVAPPDRAHAAAPADAADVAEESSTTEPPGDAASAEVPPVAAAPGEEPPPAPPADGVAPRAQVAKIVLPRAPSSTPPSPLPSDAPAPTPQPIQPPEPGRLVVLLGSSSWADVVVDGKKLGRMRDGPTSTWVATAQSPLLLPPGDHKLVLSNPSAEPFEKEIHIAAGETTEVPAALKRRKVTVTIHPQMPRDCLVEANGTRYGTVENFGASFNLSSPEPETPVVFDCPGRQRYTHRIGPTQPGSVVIVPEQMPTGWP